MKPRTTITAVLTIALALTIGIGSAANADEPLDPRISYALDAQPGGVLINPTTVVWPDTGAQLTIPSAITPFGLSSKCPSGTICAFQSANEGGARLSWASCSTFSTTALASVGSVANARSIGTVQARLGTTVVASTSAGNFANVYSPTDNIRCY
ncbi:hypothetical protein ACFVSU_10695 [Microbacterium sp. NPDC058062]|uniref:hypothetical protein n=1 Tax=Microbacterium sp. NPDC058062 TaxID=3346320 RepID=UPI0036DF9F63